LEVGVAAFCVSTCVDGECTESGYSIENTFLSAFLISSSLSGAIELFVSNRYINHSIRYLRKRNKKNTVKIFAVSINFPNFAF
ncbi:MAG TPA: hypothetical protein DDW85_12450, partial [Porphyromonadaceae bacterium]|nr:hypothetical protein [Porphyromonadaceae bacterium]